MRTLLPSEERELNQNLHDVREVLEEGFENCGEDPDCIYAEALEKMKDVYAKMGMHFYKPGDDVVIPDNQTLGTDAFDVKIISLENYGYRVREQNGDEGQVNFDLNPVFPI